MIPVGQGPRLAALLPLLPSCPPALLTAGVIATVIGIAPVFFLFSNKDNEQRLLGEHHKADSMHVEAKLGSSARSLAIGS